MTKKKAACYVAALLLGVSATGSAFGQGSRGQTRPDGAGDITIGKVGATQSLMVNGRPVNRDMTPRTLNGTVMVPIRFVAEYLGGQVDWNAAQRLVRVTQERRDLTMTVGTTRATLNGEGRALSAPPVIVGGRTLIPLREVARFFNADVRYNPSTRTVFVDTATAGAPGGGGAGAGGSAAGAGGANP